VHLVDFVKKHDRLSVEGFELASHLDPEGALTSPLFPGFTLPLKKLVE
jgi:hypothetical protein